MFSGLYVQDLLFPGPKKCPKKLLQFSKKLQKHEKWTAENVNSEEVEPQNCLQLSKKKMKKRGVAGGATISQRWPGGMREAIK